MKIVCNIILILTVCISVVYSYIQRNEYEDRLWTLNSLLIENKNELFNIKEKLSTELKLEGYILDDSITSIIPPYTLILRLHNNVCLSCYTDILLKLKSELEKKNQDLFILGSYTFESNLKKKYLSFNVQHKNMPIYQHWLSHPQIVSKRHIFFS